MSKTLAQYSIAQLEEYISLRKRLEQFENISEAKSTVEKPSKTKVKTKRTRGKGRSTINPADVIAAIKKAGAEGISGAKLQEAIGTTFNTFRNWFEKYGKENGIEKNSAKKGPGFIYTLKA